MYTVEVKHKYLISKWAPIICTCHTSGMTVKAWCQENNVNNKPFFYWQRRVRNEICVSSENSDHGKPISFVPLQFPDHHKGVPKLDSFRTDMVLNFGNYLLGFTNKTSPLLLENVLIIGNFSCLMMLPVLTRYISSAVILTFGVELMDWSRLFSRTFNWILFRMFSFFFVVEEQI